MSTEKLVANELLAFLQQKLDVMDEVSAIQICKSSCSEDEISGAKKLLYGLLNKSGQMMSRRRDGTPKSLQDIITLLKETDPDDVPTFVAKWPGKQAGENHLLYIASIFKQILFFFYHVNEDTCELYKADSGAISFKVRTGAGIGVAHFALSSKLCPLKDMYKFMFGPTCKFEDNTKRGEHIQKVEYFELPVPLNGEFQEYWLSWYNGAICLGKEGHEQFFNYVDDAITFNNISFVKFYTMTTHWPVDWLFEAPPAIINAKTQQFEDGKLRWERMTEGHLPMDALIGGFEDEPIYIARSLHNESVCPGKYVPSKNLAYVAWGSREHVKMDFEILCGYNAEWVKTNGNRIPPNAFIAGSSEVRNEPLYIGRAMYDGNLLVGKIHVIYKTCYLPYKSKEVEVYEFDILVSSDVVPRGIMAT